MLDIDRTIESREIDFVFERGEHKGEHYFGGYQICQHPQCLCENIDFTLCHGEETVLTGQLPQKYVFSVNVFKRQVFNSRYKNFSKSARTFARSFANELSCEDWQLLQKIHYDHKVYYTEHTPTKEIEVEFPKAEEIEESGLLISYHDVLPYARQLFVIVEGEEYFIEPHYCVLPECPCEEAFLSFIQVNKKEIDVTKVDNNRIFKGGLLARIFNPSPASYEVKTRIIKRSKTAYLDITVDYRNKSWKNVDSKGVTVTPDALLDELFRQKLHKTIAARHIKLRKLYRKFINENPYESDQTSPVVNKNLKVGRNESCPCGSGKKYKKCCGA